MSVAYVLKNKESSVKKVDYSVILPHQEVHFLQPMRGISVFVEVLNYFFLQEIQIKKIVFKLSNPLIALTARL